MDEQAHTEQRAEEHADAGSEVSDGFAGVRVAKDQSQQGEYAECLAEFRVVMVVCTVGGDGRGLVVVHRELQSARTPMPRGWRSILGRHRAVLYTTNSPRIYGDARIVSADTGSI